ncbi:TPA: hypothetical protein HA241_04165 [Candidatus Woesearchaeota archaeon]|nr:hypothetical protein [Candidatus Woesearchaeota archaeon]
MPGLPPLPRISPAAAPKEVGDVKLGEGARGAEVAYNTLEGYKADDDFGVQPIRIRFLGVREQSEAQAKLALETMAQQYRE